MKYGIVLLALVACVGCSTIKTVDEALSKAAVLATGPCAQAVHTAVDVCNKK